MEKRGTRLSPRPDEPSYLLLRTLAAQLRREIAACWRTEGPERVLDVGCGDRPYEQLFGERVREYVGVDAHPGPGVDIVADVHDLPVASGQFDCVLCSQVLEHVPDPGAAVHEMARVLRPGGVLLLSTHGVAPYHANPDDFWRWTHAGLRQLLATGEWDQPVVHANGGPASAVAYLTTTQLQAFATRSRLGAVARPLTFVTNLGAWRLDRIVARGGPALPALSPNYLVRARRSSALS